MASFFMSKWSRTLIKKKNPTCSNHRGKASLSLVPRSLHWPIYFLIIFACLSCIFILSSYEVIINTNGNYIKSSYKSDCINKFPIYNFYHLSKIMKYWKISREVSECDFLKGDQGLSFSMSFSGGSVVKNLATMQETQETQVQFLSQEDSLEEEMATHSRILAWRIPWSEEPGKL